MFKTYLKKIRKKEKKKVDNLPMMVSFVPGQFK